MASPIFTRFLFISPTFIEFKNLLYYFVLPHLIVVLYFHYSFIVWIFHCALTIISWSARENPKLNIAHCCAYACTFQCAYSMGLHLICDFLLI